MPIQLKLSTHSEQAQTSSVRDLGESRQAGVSHVQWVMKVFLNRQSS